MKFTDFAIKNLKPKEKKYYVRADLGAGKHGFAMCVYPSGVKTWFFIYTFGGKRCSLALGNYPDVTLAKASATFDEHWKVFREGKNPALLEEEKKRQEIESPTVTKLCEEYIEKYAKKKKKTWPEDERALNKEVVPVWGKRKAKDITKRDVVLLLESLIEREAPVMANRLRALIQKMFNFAVERDILEFNPCAGVKALHTEKPKDRALSDDEIRALWANLEKEDVIMSEPLKRALKLILLTAQRPGEVTGMHSREIKGRWWTIPPERIKTARHTNRSHRVYLSDMAFDLVKDLKGDGYIFKSPSLKGPNNEEQPIGEKALACALRRNIKGQDHRKKRTKRGHLKELPENLNRLGIAFFTPHDLRRTAASLMAQSRVPFEHRERVLNHTMSKMDSTYNQHDFDHEKQAALETLEQKLHEILAPAKGLIPLHEGEEWSP